MTIRKLPRPFVIALMTEETSSGLLVISVEQCVNMGMNSNLIPNTLLMTY